MTTAAPVIHIVDDDESFRTSVARLLRVSGYQVALYDSAHRLLQTPSGMTPGCILLDVRMPGVSGPARQLAMT
jgi:FixJ family two-component response regulator